MDITGTEDEDDDNTPQVTPKRITPQRAARSKRTPIHTPPNTAKPQSRTCRRLSLRDATEPNSASELAPAPVPAPAPQQAREQEAAGQGQGQDRDINIQRLVLT